MEVSALLGTVLNLTFAVWITIVKRTTSKTEAWARSQVKCILFESYKAISTRIVQQSVIKVAQKNQNIYKGRRMEQH